MSAPIREIWKRKYAALNTLMTEWHARSASICALQENRFAF